MEEEFLVYVVVWIVLVGGVSGAIWQNKGGSFGAGFFIGALFGFLGLIYVAAAKPGGAAARATTQPARTNIAWTHTGTRYLLGYTVDPPAYGIWDSQAPGLQSNAFPTTSMAGPVA